MGLAEIIEGEFSEPSEHLGDMFILTATRADQHEPLREQVMVAAQQLCHTPAPPSRLTRSCHPEKQSFVNGLTSYTTRSAVRSTAVMVTDQREYGAGAGAHLWSPPAGRGIVWEAAAPAAGTALPS